MSDAPVVTFASPTSTIWITGVAGAIIVLLVGIPVGLGLANGQHMAGLALFTLLAAALVCFAIAKLKFDRTILFRDRVERRTFFNSASIQRAEITGFRLRAFAVELVGPEHGSLRITQEVLFDPTFKSWILTLTDFEAVEREKTAHSLETRGDVPENADLVARVATLLGLAVAAWAWCAPSLPAHIAAIAAPPITLVLALWARGAFELLGATDDRDRLRKKLGMELPRARVHSVLGAWLFPAFVAMMAPLSSETQPPFNFALVAALFIPMVAAAWVADVKIRRVHTMLVLALVILGWAWSAALSLQGLLGS